MRKKDYLITIRNGSKEDTFTMKASSPKEARKTAHIAHIGTGWGVCRVVKTEV